MAFEREYAAPYTTAAKADVDSRATFIWRTYSHLLFAILAFASIEMALYQTGALRPAGGSDFCMHEPIAYPPRKAGAVMLGQ